MSSRIRARPFTVTAVAALAIFLAVLVLLAVRMAGGHDPALGARTGAAEQRSTTAAQAPAVVPAPSYDEGYADDGGTYSGSDGYGTDETYAAPAAPTEQQSSSAPLQSGTS